MDIIEFNQKVIDVMHEIWMMMAEIVETKIMPLVMSFFRLIRYLSPVCADNIISSEDSLI